MDRWILVKCKPSAPRFVDKKRTMIVFKRALTDPKAAFAGVMLEVLFAVFRSSMPASNVERATSRPPSSSWGLEAMVKTVDSRKNAVGNAGCEEVIQCVNWVTGVFKSIVRFRKTNSGFSVYSCSAKLGVTSLIYPAYHLGMSAP